MSQAMYQEMLERQFSRKHIDGYIRDWIEVTPEIQAKVKQGAALLEDWRSQDYYDSKNRRLAQLAHLDFTQLVKDIFVGIAYITRETLFSSVAAQLAGRLRLDDKVDAITTLAEMLAMLCETDAFDINKADKDASLMLVSRLELPETLVRYIEQSQYLPPMVCPPEPLRSNFTSGYLTHNDSLILKTGNHHDGDICRDVLHIMNQVPLKLATDFLSTVEEKPTFALDTPDKRDQWQAHKTQSYQVYTLMVQHGNRFYLTHKVDKRGRIYCQGYHINPQGAAFKKAMVELANEEIVDGVPVDHQIQE